MSSLNNRQRLPALDQEPERLRPIEQLHPVLFHIVEHMEMLPPEGRESITATELAHAVSLAISMLPEDEQSYIISRIMSDDEIAEERLQSPQVQDLQHRIHLSANEIRLLLRGSPEPEDDGEEVEPADACIVCASKSDVTVPCGCHYCGHCLRENIRVGLRSEVDFPTGCCNRPFNEATVRLAQRPALVHLFRQLSAEYSVQPGERLYCHDPGCASFIPASAIQAAARDEDNATAMGTCPSCHKATCAACGGRSHRGLPCREEEDDEALLNMMDSQGLVGCPSCLCGAEFCYICGRDWGARCGCPEYNGLNMRVPVRQRPGRRPILRGGRAHLVSNVEGTPRIPQLRYDPEDEAALAAVDYAPIGASVPTAVPNPGPNRVQEPIPRRNRAEHMEIPADRDVPRPPQHRQHARVARPNNLNRRPIGLPPIAALFPFLELEEPPLPIPGAFPGAFSDPFPPVLPPPVGHPIPYHPPDHPVNNQLPELHPLADGDVDLVDHAIEQLRIATDALEDQLEDTRRQSIMAIRDLERLIRQDRGLDAVPREMARLLQEHEESQRGGHGRRRRRGRR
ncbi:hypothetical protein THAR02_10384 [Trichoderma harzianum]|uniref:IBR domain-containing protein n=1 Tax=Trichoderma harzianum TaxID=5544 RepID=A0A0F9ZAB8_TRIHA|nr:hypothetical protein THAR02_10384 [Trichoderma harzianum]